MKKEAVVLNSLPYYFLDDYGILIEDLEIKGEASEAYIEYNRRYLENLNNELLPFYAKEMPDVVNEEKLENYYRAQGFTELILKVTEKCNFRCKYCVYSDYYPYTTSYGSADMTFETAKKAIDLYMKQVERQRYFVLNKIPFIAFYGGEPLLNFELVKDVIEYVKTQYGDYNVIFTVTTNGLPLEDQQIANFLKKHNVIICLSLDGYPENHDRNRIRADGRPSYDTILSIIHKSFLDYPLIYTLCCIDYRTDLFKLYDFYNNNDRINGGNIPHLLRISRIFDIGTNYYDQFTLEERTAYIKSFKELEKKYIELAISDKSDWFLDLLIGQEILRVYDRLRFAKNQGFYLINGCCIPGEKIFVQPNGLIGICEKVCFDLSIGDVDSGINLKSVAEIINKMNKLLYFSCKECSLSSLCSICYAYMLTPDEIGVSENECCNRRSSFIHSLSVIQKIESENKGFFERKISEIIRKNKEAQLSQLLDILLR
ncbi:hypothetical protein CSTERTH_13090 [Thermoclostridium stercorarium subsp. thermolacticum DSM 2910]|uniref:Radical SAM core domain-containing protein n=1 Tax=Thermoclostridium stercorarium subsp. thermolacticum DSM 2910 TaxID=1121336 RepID=A0A1B1YGL3_THEST|nr:radical SAM protein [Thermoclostridium stercorarium]ANW99895.1 hypothetical protein CSTERTH_13090 [Thermoclostridium stercorarium subsp. thermolacticum DSM 2910]